MAADPAAASSTTSAAYELLVRLLGARTFIITQASRPSLSGTAARGADLGVERRRPSETEQAARRNCRRTSTTRPGRREQDDLDQRAHGMLPEQNDGSAKKSLDRSAHRRAAVMLFLAARRAPANAGSEGSALHVLTKLFDDLTAAGLTAAVVVVAVEKRTRSVMNSLAPAPTRLNSKVASETQIFRPSRRIS